MKASPVTYRKAGVDIDAADRFVGRIGKLAAATRRPEVLAGIGPFAAAVAVPKGMRQPVMVSSSDGVGTKLAVARLAGRHDTIGIDLVAMNANDLITAGARPMFFLDYLAVGVLASVDAEAIVRGIANGCLQAGMSLVGGETAEMPGFYKEGEYDLAGFCVGVVERKEILDGSKVRIGDAVLGLDSSGLHSNGYSLARKVLKATTKESLMRHVPELGRTLGEELLEPTLIYVRPLLEMMGRMEVRAMAHITGGGLSGNLVRVLPPRVRAVISRSALPDPPIFRMIRERARIGADEMERTFNCGTGFTVIVPEVSADNALRFLRRRRVPARRIGRIERGERAVVYSDD
ncbi:MAG TPA: phosphoribosylformylglycinamidine cyclo-ligase [Candidatus Binatia bacterium]|nr:phosphoribosylformylglycinamidine cyclo-ligase [Candidatus Binatia bacterium]